MPLDKARVVRQGSDVTLVAYGDGFVAALEACSILEGEGISAELIDLVSLNPLDIDTITASVAKTGRLLTVDTANAAFSVGSQVIGKVVEHGAALKDRPVSLATPDVPCPTSPALTAEYYPTSVSIANTVLDLFGKKKVERVMTFEELHLPPGTTLPPL